MFAEFLRVIEQASNPRFNHPFVEQLRPSFRQNIAMATLWARWNWQHIPAAVATAIHQMNAAVAQQGQWMREQREINDTVNARLGALGISPSYGGYGSSHGMSYDPEEVLMLTTLSVIREHSGDPRSHPDLVRVAEEILQGRRDPMDALVLSAPHPQRARARAMLRLGVPFLPHLRRHALVVAALALPRARIPAWLGFADEPAAAPTAEQVFARQMATAQGHVERGDWKAAEVHIFEALRAAEATPDAADDLESVQYALLAATQHKVDPEVLRVALRVVTALLEHPRHAEQAAEYLAHLSTLIDGYELSSELDEPVLRAIQVVLDDGAAHAQLALGLKASVICLRQGDSSRAAAFLDDVQALLESPQDHLELAMARADVAWSNLDREGAAVELAAAIEEHELGAPDAAVMVAIQKLVSLWPDGEPGLEKWVAKLDAHLEHMEEPERTLNRLTILIAWARLGKHEALNDFAERVDFAKLRAGLSPALHPMLDQVEQAIRG